MARNTRRPRRYRVCQQAKDEITRLYGSAFANSDLVIDHIHPASEFYRPADDPDAEPRTLFDDEVELIEDGEVDNPNDPLAGLTASVVVGEDRSEMDDWPWQTLPGVQVSLAGERSVGLPVVFARPDPDEIVIRLGLHDLVVHPSRGRRVAVSLVVHDGLTRQARHVAEDHLEDRALAAFERLTDHGPVDVRRVARLPSGGASLRVIGHG